MNRIIKALTLVLVMTLCIGVIFTFAGCEEDKPIDELNAIHVAILNGEDVLILSEDNANVEAIKEAIQVTASFSGKDIAEIIDQYEIVGFDPNIEGEQNITVRCMGLEATIKVSVQKASIEHTLTAIKIDKVSVVLSEDESTEAVLRSKITVNAVYSDASETTITDYTLEGFDSEADGEQTVSIKYLTFSASIKVTIERSVEPDKPTNYFVCIGNTLVEMVENTEADKQDGKLIEYMATVDLVIGDSISIKDNLGNVYANYQDCDFDGNAKVEGSYTIYLKLYSDGHAIYVTVPQESEPETIKMYINGDAEGRVLEEYPSEDISVIAKYFIKAELKAGDLVIFKAGAVEYDAYERFCSFDGVASIDGEYKFYVKFYMDGGYSIWVDKPIAQDPTPTPTPDTVNVYFYNYVNWANVSAYAWNGSGDNASYTTKAWPGDVMSAVADHDGWYSVAIAKNSEKIIFNNSSSGSQTTDLTIDYEKPYFNGYEWTDGFNIHEEVATIKMYINRDTEGRVLEEYPSEDISVIAKYFIKAELKSGDLVIFKAGSVEYDAYERFCSFDGVASIDGEYKFYLKFYMDGGYSIWVDKPIAQDPIPTPTPDTVNVYFYNYVNWANISAYAWNGFGENSSYTTKAWPGDVMSAVADHDGWYSIAIAKNSEKIIFNNSNNGSQTADLTIDYEKPYFNGYEWTDGFNIHEESAKITVFFYNYKNWSNVNVHAWNALGNNGWPGQEMTVVEGHDNWYQVEISGDYVNLLFNAGDQMPQTLNLTIDVDNLYYNGYDWTNDFNVYEGILSRTVYYFNKYNWASVNAYAWTESGESKIEFSEWSGTQMAAVEGYVGWFSIEIGIEYKNIIFNDGSNQTDNLTIDDENGLYYYNDGWSKEFGESVDPTPDVPTITENSVIYFVVGETKTQLVINEGRQDDVLEFMIEKIELEANTTFKITVDGQEINNYKAESDIKGTITEAGDYCIYVSNDGIYVAPYTPPTPTTPTLSENSVVKLFIKSGENVKEYSLVINESSLDGNIEYMIQNVTITANDVIVIKVEDVEITNYKNELVKDGHVSEDGNYSFYVADSGIYVAKEIAVQPTLESIKVNETQLTIEKAEASIEVIKGKIIVTAVYSDSSEKAISEYEISGLNEESYEAQTLTISFEGKSATLTVTINEPQPIISSIEVDKDFISLTENEATVDGIKSKIEVKAVYSNGNKGQINDEDYTVVGFNAEADGEQAVTIKYLDFTATIKVTVEHPIIPVTPTLESIKVNETQLTIEKAEASIEVIKGKIIVTAVYSDSSEKAISEYEISGLNEGNYEAQTLTISYEGKTTTIVVTINEPQPIISSIEVDKDSISLTENEATVDGIKSKIEVKAVYSNGNKGQINAEDYTVEGFNAEADGEQTVTIKYLDFTATIKVTVEHPVTKYYVYINDTAFEMIENAEADKNDGKLAEYNATVDLGIGDTITVKDSLGNAYETFENFSGKAVWRGNHIVYLKLYSEGHSIWVGTPQVILDNQTVVKILVDNDIRTLSLNTDKTDGIEYKIENVAVTTENIIKVLVGEVETANYKNSLVVNGKVTENGNYNFYVADDGIWVEKVNESTVDPDTPYSVSIIVNNDEPIVMSESESDNANVTAQYTVTVTLKEGDVVKIIDSTSFVFVNYEDTTSFKGTAASDGEYTFYAKKYKDGGDSIWVAVPVSVDPTPDVPVTSDTITVYYYNVKGWNNVNAYAWVNNDTNKAWPGETMAAVEGQDGWYSIEISTSYTSIIFNAGNGGEQTRNITIVTDKYYFNGYEWTDGYNTQEKRIVYFKNTAEWNSVYAYSWVDKTNNSWPGQTMTAVDGHDGWYMLELSADYNMIIFNNNSGTQTADLEYKVGSTYYDFSKNMWVESF